MITFVKNKKINMKKYLCCLALSAMTMTAMADDVMTKSGDTLVVNTTTLCDTKGYRGTTPMKVYFLKNKIVKIVPLKNMETKRYFMRVEQELIPNYVGLKVAKAQKMVAPESLDAVTGATLSSNAVKSNVYAAIQYYSKHK